MFLNINLQILLFLKLKERKIMSYSISKLHNKILVTNNLFLKIIIFNFILGLVLAIPIVLNISKNIPDDETIDWTNPPCSPNDLGKNWKDITHPRKQLKTPDKTFQNIHTNEIIEFHPHNSKGQKQPHCHRKNPNASSRHDYYLDKNGQPVRKNSKPSHIYIDC